MAEVMKGCEVVFHLAALISIPYSYQAPESFVDTNVRGTLNVLMAARRHGNVRIIHTSTSEVYGTPETIPITESHPLRAQSPYAASKIAADKLAESFYHTYELPVTVLRPFNTYGPRQSARAVLPTVLTQLLSGCREIRLGALWPRRDLTFVSDTVEGFVRAAMVDEAIGRTVQLGTGQDLSIEELVKLTMNVLGRRAEVVCEHERLRPANSEIERLVSDPSLALQLLGWHPTVSLEDGILRTAEWLSGHLQCYLTGQYLV
jgi:UDP-glucose 4-epimerase